MKCNLIVFSFFCSFIVTAAFAATKTVKPVLVAVIEDSSKSEFESKTLPILTKEIGNCTGCEIKNFSPYDATGNFNEKELSTVLKGIQSESGILYMGWNRPVSIDNKAVAVELQSLIKAGVVVIGSAGIVDQDTPITTLSRTVLGQIPEVFIIGELKERETLLQKSHFGPEMLTALQPPKELLSQGKGPLFFVAKLAQNWGRRTSSEWMDFFKTTKAKSKKLWPSMNDFFGR